ncbi:Predicted dehydrogenase [Pseudorhodobacter antarcticus]|uniref:Predicted dehydrogenase n=1 Tax=Pseudorhodobacter antarcticus TaxID=1077947 RepID=A0A1H8K8F8_9RHOB|nr:Predicted dehydrogenase [Pseudorhodobacter antarcticus]
MVAIKTAIIGLGIMGQRMATQMMRHPEYTVCTLWDPDLQACRAAKDIAPDATVAKSAEDAMAGADLVYLACPPVPRKAYALAAAAQGSAVFLEKPLGINIAESRDLADRLAASGVPTAVNFTQAAGPALQGVSVAAKDGTLGQLAGVDIIVTYANWPRAWQAGADWLRFRDEGGMTREVISHFLFFTERILGPLELIWAQTDYPQDADLCETHVASRLINAHGVPVSILGTVGGVQPDRQEVTIKGSTSSRRISDFYRDAVSFGGDFVPVQPDPDDPRAASLGAQLDDMAALIAGKPSRLATVPEALRVQILIEGILAGTARP